MGDKIHPQFCGTASRRSGEECGSASVLFEVPKRGHLVAREGLQSSREPLRGFPGLWCEDGRDFPGGTS